MSKCALIGRECPKTNSPNAKFFCPAWSDGIVWTNTQTGEERIVHCSFEALMPALVEVIKASNRPAAAIESTRNEISRQLQEGFSIVGGAISTIAALPMANKKEFLE